MESTTPMRAAKCMPVMIVLALAAAAVTCAAVAPATQRVATSQPAATSQPTPPSAEQVLKGVLENRPQAQPLLPMEPGKPVKAAIGVRAANPVQSGQERQDLLQDGYPLKRTGRLVNDGNWWTLVPEGSGQSAEPERPIRLLPNRLLETMEATSVGGTKPLIFTVTGQVTEYRGMNYLMVLNVMIKRDQGNLSK
jgi:hypothetical protein